eukprot:4455799-Lingulodinium_polyedra.AAC.1
MTYKSSQESQSANVRARVHAQLEPKKLRHSGITSPPRQERLFCCKCQDWHCLFKFCLLYTSPSPRDA